MAVLSLKTEPKDRLYSLDALRGFDMFWIIGGEALIIAFAKASGWDWLDKLATQMHHVPWNGFHFYDLIFPLFMFISGVAIPFALTSKLEKGVAKKELIKKVTIRMLLLVAFGIVYNGALQNGFSSMRAASVLGQIGISYALAAFIVLNTSSVKPRIFWLFGIWSLIAVLQLFIPVQGYGAGVITPEGSINAWIDQHFLPGRFHFEMYDPEGILCIVSATTVTLMGTFAGSILRSIKLTAGRKAVFLLISGISLVLIALVLSGVYPVIKNIWTVPFTMLTAGISFLLLALFYYIIDIRGWRRWTFFFRIIGLNSITIYLGTRIIDFHHTSEFLLGWFANPLGEFGPVVILSGLILAEWLFLYYLYKNKIFLRV
ncbi:acyltransferase family protein [Bacteroidota bacterium]